MTSRPSPTLPRRFRNDERGMIVVALRARATEMRRRSQERTDAYKAVYADLTDQYDELADRIRDGGPLVQQIYYGIRVPLRERRDDRKDRT